MVPRAASRDGRSGSLSTARNRYSRGQVLKSAARDGESEPTTGIGSSTGLTAAVLIARLRLAPLLARSSLRCSLARRLRCSWREPRGGVRQIGRASCRERVEISVVAVSLKKKKKKKTKKTNEQEYQQNKNTQNKNKKQHT